MSAVPVAERNQDATIYVGGLDERVNETVLWELFVQAGPVGMYCKIGKFIFLFSPRFS